MWSPLGGAHRLLVAARIQRIACRPDFGGTAEREILARRAPVVTGDLSQWRAKVPVDG
ncbi:MAG: hypothetical protein HW391_1771 [Chloroflexi bacterium]|nr:hypothetical protein [Chloroflexota bacterium]